MTVTVLCSTILDSAGITDWKVQQVHLLGINSVFYVQQSSWQSSLLSHSSPFRLTASLPTATALMALE
jgi:hypothetical protein